jgi:hypothetical protein
MTQRAKPARTGENTWIRVIESIDKPLGFYVLALLIVETFLGSVLIFARMTEENRFWGMILGAAMFGVVLVVVSLLSAFRPHHLMYDRDAHLVDRGKVPYGSRFVKVTDLDQLPKRGRPRRDAHED